MIYYCEKCNKLVTEKFGSGRFCSRSCANSRIHSDETKLKISESVKHSEKFISSNNKYHKNNWVHTGYYKGYYCGSTWELAYLIYCLDHNIEIQRNKKVFDYIYENQKHTYLPDWYLPASNQYVEIKGMNQFYNANIIEAKSKSVIDSNNKLIYIDDKSINFYIKYVLKNYKVTNIKYLYDGSKPIYKNPLGKHVPKTSGYKALSKDNIKTLVKPELVMEYLKNGWVLGWK